MKNFYEILGVTKFATKEEIKKSYLAGAKKHHPDVNPGDSDAIKRFQEFQQAYETLSDPIKKSKYDSFPHMQFRSRPTKDNSDFSFDSVVESFFGGSTYKGRSITVRLQVEFKEVFVGCKKNINIKKRNRCTGCTGNGFTSSDPCSICEGSGKVQVADAPFGFISECKICKGTGRTNVVKCGDCIGSGYIPGYCEKTIEINVPPGIENGTQVRLAGEGEESIHGGRAGDVIVVILVGEHDVFKRDGLNLSVDVPVSYTQLVLGDEVEIPTLPDGFLKVKIPVGSQSHTKFRLKGKGFSTFMGHMGDLIATLKIETPKILDQDYKNVLEKLSDLEKKNITPRREQWIKKINNDNK